MQQVMSNLWIGDYSASQDAAELSKHGIRFVVSAMRQQYEIISGTTVHQIAVDDTETTNIIEHFVPCSNFIAKARVQGAGVLVHCQAGMSRSATLVAAYLMKEMGLNVEQALQKIRRARSQIQPSEFFLLQLELFERCDCEWDPVKWPEERRFLMSFAQSQIMDGASPSIVLAYYPSPNPSPLDRSSSDPFSRKNAPRSPGLASPSSLTRNALLADSLDEPPTKPDVSAPSTVLLNAAPMRKRLTTKTPTSAAAQAQAEADATGEQTNTSVEKIGTKAEVVVVGRRIRCKMCRRELAAREHILVHEPGMGQQAFAPHRRDMAAHRAELEARRMDELDREARETQTDVPPTGTPSTSDSPSPAAPLPSIAGLRISKPATAIPGLRVAVPRPRPVVKPIEKPAAHFEAPIDSTSTPTDDPPPFIEPPATVDPPHLPSIQTPSAEPPLLPSHLCSSYFVEPLSWMSPILESGVLAGKIVCPSPKCGAKLGSFDWAGSQCSCGAWVCPGFALNVSRVDEISR